MILFVCTGNTCRSPMAAAIARARGIPAHSAGLSPLPGSPAAPEAVRAAARFGADLTGHRAQALSPALLEEAEQVWAMTASQGAYIRSAYPAFARKVRVLEPQIPDPYGQGDAAYARCALALEEALRKAGIIKI